jgi:hypothetical protein
MFGRLIFLAAAAVAATVPLLTVRTASPSLPAFPGWPAEFDGRPLTALALGVGERRFEADFPGKLGRFSDGSREIVIRWVTEATRSLHPTADCYRFSGFEVMPLPLHMDASGRRWAAFEAHRGQDRCRVFERMVDDRGNSWTDVSEWYWSALTAATDGPWWSYAWAERLDGGK